MRRTLDKRRSRSETRQLPFSTKSRRNQIDNESIPSTKNLVMHYNQTEDSSATRPNEPQTQQIHGRRKTSAELIQEAKTLLARASQVCCPGGHVTPSSVGGGLRLVSTRRPVTPRESRRALYGKVSLAGRPPSAFSLRYLQNEGSRSPLMPSLEPISSTALPLELNNNNSNMSPACQSLTRRWHSLDARIDACESIDAGKPSTVPTTNLKIPRKLPALEIKGESIAQPKQDDTDDSKIKTVEKYSSVRPSSAATHARRASCDNTLKSKAIQVLTSRKLLIRSFDLLTQSSTEKLIRLLKEHSGLKDCTDETASHINAILEELYMRVHKHEKLFKRGFILGGLYGLVECTSPKILLAVARVVLALRVTGSNLTGACKLIFKVARNEQNDPYFHDNDLLELLIDGLGRASPLDDPEACIYGYGSVRFLTCSSGQERAETTNTLTLNDINTNWMDSLELPAKPATAPPRGSTDFSQTVQRQLYQKLSRQSSLVQRLARHGAVELMVLHLQMLNEAGAAQQLQGPPLHSLYQLSAALRALADIRRTSSSFDIHRVAEKPTDTNLRPVTTNSIQLELACPHLIRAAEISIGELDVQANIVRTLSVLSEDADCCHTILKYTTRIGMLLGPCCENFKESMSSEKVLSLLSRLGYVLGNIMAKYDNARVQFYHNDAALEYLLNILMFYLKEPLTARNQLGDTVTDVLTKMVRVVANMSVNTEVGVGLGNTRALGRILLDLLMASNKAKNIKLRTEINELAQATLGALHNLCFYQDKSTLPAQVIESKGSLQGVLNDVATTLGITLRSTTDGDIQVETVRVLGNLTRNDRARRAFCEANGLAIIVRMLHITLTANVAGHSGYDLKACAIGVLVNLLGDYVNRLPFIQLKGDHTLIELLRNALQYEDWFLAAITCQAFWNLLMDAPPHRLDLIEANILDNLSDLLADYLDEEIIFENGNAPDNLWEEFAVVATDLLERLQMAYGQNQDDNNNTFLFRTIDAEDDTNNNHDGDDDNGDDSDNVYIDEM